MLHAGHEEHDHLAENMREQGGLYTQEGGETIGRCVAHLGGVGRVDTDREC